MWVTFSFNTFDILRAFIPYTIPDTPTSGTTPREREREKEREREREREREVFCIQLVHFVVDYFY